MPEINTTPRSTDRASDDEPYSDPRDERAICTVCGCDPGNGTVALASLANPLERMYALAAEIEVDVLDVPAEVCTDQFCGVVGGGYDQEGQFRGLVGLADDIDDDLRLDALAFGIAVFVAQPDRIAATAAGSLGIGRERRPVAPSGPGHLAWHMLHSCGRTSPSATFDLFDLDAEQRTSPAAA